MDPRIFNDTGIITKDMEIQNVLRFITRKGKALIKITMRNEADVKEVLANKKKLLNLPPPWNKVYINLDLPKSQRLQRGRDRFLKKSLPPRQYSGRQQGTANTGTYQPPVPLPRPSVQPQIQPPLLNLQPYPANYVDNMPSMYRPYITPNPMIPITPLQYPQQPLNWYQPARYGY